MGNESLNAAGRAKNDEFYTQLSDIAKECRHYQTHFSGKTIFCNCDTPYESNFFKYFAMSFDNLGLKKLIASCYIGAPNHESNAGNARGLAIVECFLQNRKNVLTRLQGDGDFRSAECIELLKEADVVVTNPPFSLFREYVAQLMKYDKKFLIIGNQNALTYKEIFKLIKENKIWLGYDNGGTKWFQVPPHYDIKTETRIKIENGIKYFSMGSIMWFTNLDHPKRHKELKFFRKYNPNDYPKYDNYNAINIGKYIDIPVDYNGVMGVPITFIDKYNPDQFEILGKTNSKEHAGEFLEGNDPCAMIKGKKLYHRILIKRKPL